MGVGQRILDRVGLVDDAGVENTAQIVLLAAIRLGFHVCCLQDGHAFLLDSVIDQRGGPVPCCEGDRCSNEYVPDRLFVVRIE